MFAIYKPKRIQPYLDGARHTFIKVRISEKETILLVCSAICGVARSRDGWAMAYLNDSYGHSHVTPCSRIIMSQSRNSGNFTECEASIPRSQQPAAYPDQSN
jgi:hypothetical protein